jgi:hypothetical protein
MVDIGVPNEALRKTIDVGFITPQLNKLLYLVGIPETDQIAESSRKRGGAASAGTAPGILPPASGALQLWREKLHDLQNQEAIIADPAQKFALKKQIEEAREKIHELGG